MARINFRQGIVRHQTDSNDNPLFLNKVGQNVNLLVSPDFTTIAFIHGNKDYLYTESVTVNNAWTNLPVGPDSWLYWDLDRITGLRTFGFTTFEPIYQATAPLPASTGQIWFNTSSNIIYEFNGVTFVEKIRVFAAKLVAGITFVSVSDGAPLFTGTQISNNTTVSVGSLAYDSGGNPIINQDGKFFTTEDTFTAGVPSGASLKINNILMRATAQEPIGPFQVVQFTDFDQISLANPFQAVGSVYGIVEDGVPTGDVANVITEGVVFNSSWNWSAAGAVINDPLYIDATGQIILVQDIPNQVPVAAVIGNQEIFFKLGIFGYGGTAGVADHGALTGLGGDDHPQYHTDARGDARYSQLGHLHIKSDITDFAHTHLKVDIADFAHTHLKVDITDFNDADYATAGEGALAASAIQPTDNVSILTNDAGYLTTETDPIFTAQKAQPNGVATLDGAGIIPTAQLPPIAITDVYVVADEPEMLALTAQVGDVAIRTDENKSHILRVADPSVLANWAELTPVNAPVTSVDGRTGVVSLTDLYATAAQGILATSALQDITGESIKSLGDVFSTMVPVAGDVLTFDVTNGWQSAVPAPGGIANVVEDLTPQLGGNLDVNGQDIISSPTTPINITAGTSLVGAGNNVNIAAGGSNGIFELLGGDIVLTPGANMAPNPITGPSAIVIQGSGNSANYSGVLNIIRGAYRTSLTVPNLTANTSFILPPNNGTSGNVLQTNGSGVTSWATVGGLNNIVEDTTPQLGGNLDVQIFNLFTTNNTGTSANSISLNAGNVSGGISSAVVGGGINLNAGYNSGGFGTGGSINIAAGDNQYIGDGGYSSTYNGNGGSVNITAGHSTDTTPGYAGNGGNITITSGNAVNTSYANAGSVTLVGGNGYYGGNIILQPGTYGGGTEGSVQIKRAGTNPGVLLIDSVTAPYVVKITAPILAASTYFTLPPNNGTSGQVLQTDGTGVTSWVTTSATAKPQYEKVIATAGQTIVPTTIATVATTATVNGTASLQVFRNGMMQEEGAGLDFTVTGANQITFVTGLTLNDKIIMFAFA